MALKPNSRQSAPLVLLMTAVLAGCAGGKVAELTSTIGAREVSIRQLQLEVSSLRAEIRRERTYRERQDRELEDYRRQVGALRADFTECSTQLNRAELGDVRVLLARVDGLESTAAEAQLKAVYRGRLDVWESLRVESTPSRGRGIGFLRKHYANFTVTVENKEVFKHQVETKGASARVSTLLSATMSVVNAAAFLRGIPIRG